MATTEEYKNGGADTYSFSIEYIKAEDIKVKVNGTPLNYTTTNPPAQTTEYTVNGSNVIFKEASVSGSTNGGVRIYRETDLGNSDSVTFQAGSAIRAADLNANHRLIKFSAQEKNQEVTEDDIRDGAITSAKIKDGTIVNADINASADIDNSKIADGLLKSGITVNSANIVNGSIVNDDINNSANIQGSKLLDDSVGLAKLGAGTLPNDIVVTRDNIQDGTIRNADIDTNADIQGSKLLDDSVALTKLGGGALPTDISVESANIVNRSIVDEDIHEGTLDNRYYTEAELNPSASAGGNVLDARYYTETESEALFLRQDSSETISSGDTWSNTDSKVATTAAIDLRVIELVDNVGGFVPIANETSFPTENPDINTSGSAKGGTIVSVQAASTALAPQNGTTLTIANGRGTGNAVIITGVTATIPSGFGFLVETTATDHTYAFHRLVPVATQVATVANNITNIVNAGANVADINNFADLYQISTSAPTARQDTTSLQIGDLWFDSSSNKVLMIYDGSSGDGFTAATPNASDLVNINIVAGQITYQEDLGLITDAVNTGSGNNSVNTVAGSISNVNTAATNIAKITTVADDLNEGTSEIDTVATNIANVNTVGNNISNVNAVANNSSNINSAVSNASNINSAVSNQSNINAAVSNATNINTVAGNNSNVTTVAGSISNVNTAATNIASINTTAASIANVNNFTDKYQVASSNPSTDGGGNALAAGDLYFNTSANELKVYTGSQWQGGVTATGNFAAVTGNTFTGNNYHGDSVSSYYGTGNDLQIIHNGNNSTIQSANVDNFTLRQQYGGGYMFIHGDNVHLRSQTGNELLFAASRNNAAKLYFDNAEKLETESTGVTVTGLMTATTIDGAAGNNLQLDFGTL